MMMMIRSVASLSATMLVAVVGLAGAGPSPAADAPAKAATPPAPKLPAGPWQVVV